MTEKKAKLRFDRRHKAPTVAEVVSRDGEPMVVPACFTHDDNNDITRTLRYARQATTSASIEARLPRGC